MAYSVHLAIALTLTALGLAPGVAHLLELPVKLGYPAQLYAEVTSTLYAWYGVVGGAVQVAAAIAVGLLALRAAPARGLVIASAVALVVSLALWASIVASVNSSWAALPREDAAAFAAEYIRLRPRWEFGHLAAFLAWLTGWLGLVAAVAQLLSSAPRSEA